MEKILAGYTMFVEYTIKEGMKDAYVAFMKDRLSRENGVEWLESAEQPGLFVEMWSGVEDVEAFRGKRKGETASGWMPLLDMIAGGAARMHIWAFRPVHAPGEEQGIRPVRP